MPIVAEVIAVVLAHAIGAWLITYLLHSGVLIAAAWLFERVHEDAALQAVAWRTALIAPLVTASLHTAVPFGSPLRLSTEPAGTLLGPRPLLALALAVCWCVLTAARMCVVVRAELRGQAALRLRTPCTDARWLGMLAAHARAAGMRRTPKLTTSPAIFSPAAFGRDEICVPVPFFESLAPAQQNALLAHELAHHQRRDPLWCGAGAVIAALCRFQPLNRVALRRLRRVTEHAADARALRTVQPGDLARALAALAPYALRAPHLRTAATGSPLVERIGRILQHRPGPQPATAATACLLVAALVASCLALGPGVDFRPDTAANSIPSLTPSRAAPTRDMLEMRRIDRSIRALERTLDRRIAAALRV